MMDHAVTQKLKREILPWLVSSRRLGRQWFYRIGVVYGYANDILIALAGAGFTGSALTALARARDASGGAPPTPINLEAIIREPLANAGFVLLIFWLLLKVYVVREGVVARTVAVRSCLRQFRGAQVRLERTLATPAPMDELNKLYLETIVPASDRALQDDIWPWGGTAPDIADEVLKEAERYSQMHGANWTPVASGREERP